MSFFWTGKGYPAGNDPEGLKTSQQAPGKAGKVPNRPESCAFLQGLTIPGRVRVREGEKKRPGNWLKMAFFEYPGKRT